MTQNKGINVIIRTEELNRNNTKEAEDKSSTFLSKMERKKACITDLANLDIDPKVLL